MIPAPAFYLLIALGIFACVVSWRRRSSGTSIFLAVFMFMTAISRAMYQPTQPEAMKVMAEIAGIIAATLGILLSLWLLRRGVHE